MYDRGMAHYLGEEPELEVLDYRQIIKVDPTFYIAYINLGRAYAKLERYVEAEEVLTKSIQLADERNSNNGMAWLELARVREKAGDADGARQAYLEATSRLPLVSWTHYYYARFLETQKQFDGAMSAYEKVVETSTDKAWAYQEAGDFARRVGLPRKALIYYRAAVDSDPKDSLAQTYLAETYYELGDRDNARIRFERAIALAGNPYYPYASYAWYLYREGDYEKAAEMYQKSLSLRPNSEDELKMLARVYVKLNNCQKALQTYSEILSSSQNLSPDTVQEARTNLESISQHCDEQIQH